MSDRLTIPMGEYGEERLSFGIEPEPAGHGLMLSVTAGGETYYLFERDWSRLRRLLDGMDATVDRHADPPTETMIRLATADSMMRIALDDARRDGIPGETRAWDEALLWLRHVYLSADAAIHARRGKGV